MLESLLYGLREDFPAPNTEGKENSAVKPQVLNQLKTRCGLPFPREPGVKEQKLTN